MEQVTAVFWCIFLTVFTSAEQATSFRNAFIEVDNSNLNAVKNGEVFNRVFHQCSVDANCKFVLVDTQINVFKMYTKKVDLPSGNQKMRIWEKHSQDKCAGSPCKNGGTCNGNSISYSCQCAPDFTGTNCERTWEDNCYFSVCVGYGSMTNSNKCLQKCKSLYPSKVSANYHNVDRKCRCCGAAKGSSQGWLCMLV